jgi:hypothetical protein
MRPCARARRILCQDEQVVDRREGGCDLGAEGAGGVGDRVGQGVDGAERDEAGDRLPAHDRRAVVEELGERLDRAGAELAQHLDRDRAELRLRRVARDRLEVVDEPGIRVELGDREDVLGPHQQDRAVTNVLYFVDLLG